MLTSEPSPVADETEKAVVVDPSKPARPRSFAFGFPANFRPLREGAAVCAFIAVAVTFYLRLWRAPFRVPWSYHGDGISTLELIKSIMSGGWDLHTARVGAPFTGSTVDFPIGGESFHYFVIKLMGYVLRSPALTDNVYYLLSYFAVGLSAYYVVRYLRLRRTVAWFVAVLYTFLPYHQIHGEIQTPRSMYYIVPVDILVMLWLVSWRSELYRSSEGRLVLRRGRVLFAIGVFVLQGISDTQTSGFCICILIAMGVLLAWGHRSWKPLKWGVGFAATIGITLALANTPYLWAHFVEGPNQAAVDRSLTGQDTYGLRLVFMLLPVEHHWLAPLAHLTAKARTAGEAMYTEPGQSLGFLGAAGWVCITVAALGNTFGTRGLASRLRSSLQTLGTISLVAILIAAVGGLGFLIALFGFDYLRTWDRIVVIIGFLAYLGLGLLLQVGLDRWNRRRSAPGRSHAVPTRLIAIPVVGLILTLGIADQAPPSTVPQYNSISATWNVDSAFFSRLESMLPKGSMIFQFPIMVYPENGPVANLYDYDEFAGYIHTHTLKWSYGAIKGRVQGDWQTGTLSNMPQRTQLAALSAVGFAGIWVARNGYADNGASFDASIRPLLGPPALVSSDGRMEYYSLAPITSALHAAMSASQIAAFRAATLTGVQEHYAPTFSPLQAQPVPFRWSQQESQMTIQNDGADNYVNFTGNLDGNGRGQVTIRVAGKAQTIVFSKSGPAPFNLAFRLPKGSTTVSFSAVNTGFANSWFQLSGLQVAPPAVHSAMCALETGPTRPLDC